MWFYPAVLWAFLIYGTSTTPFTCFGQTMANYS